jgi:hypothetical protein
MRARDFHGFASCSQSTHNSVTHLIFNFLHAGWWHITLIRPKISTTSKQLTVFSNNDPNRTPKTEISHIMAYDPTTWQICTSKWNASPCPAHKSSSKVQLWFELSHDPLNTIIRIPSLHGVLELGNWLLIFASRKYHLSSVCVLWLLSSS